MASREEVFQRKVLRKLYLGLQKPEKARISESDAEDTTEKSHLGIKAVKRPTTSEKLVYADAGKASPPYRRLYTVLPPPPDFGSSDKGTDPLLDSGNANTDAYPSDEDGQLSEGESREQQRRRKKKRKTGISKAGAAPESLAVQSTDPTNGGLEAGAVATLADGETKLSRNKRRKLKKKRRKEKLLSLGMASGASALQFTYQPEGGSGGELVEDPRSSEQQRVELLEFLQATLEVYTRSSAAGKQEDLGLSPSAQALLTGLSAEAIPASDMGRLQRLKSLVLLRDAEQLCAELGEFQHSATIPPEEVSLVCSLFHYWITDILPGSGAQTAQTP